MNGACGDLSEVCPAEQEEYDLRVELLESVPELLGASPPVGEVAVDDDGVLCSDPNPQVQPCTR